MSIWIEAARPKTLMASICPVMLAAALNMPLSMRGVIIFTCSLLFALFAQIGANFSNDYFDAKKGADTKQRRGPVRAVAAGLVKPESMRLATVYVFLVSFLFASILGFYVGWAAPILGAVCILCALSYTSGPFPLAYIGLGDLFVVLFFGFVPTGFTAYMLQGAWSIEAFLMGLGAGLISTGILTVNNLRDIKEDAKNAKCTLAVRFGKKFAQAEYAFCIALAFIMPTLVAYLLGSFTLLAVWLLFPHAIALIRRIYTQTGAAEQNKLLGHTGRLLALYTLFFILGMLWTH